VTEPATASAREPIVDLLDAEWAALATLAADFTDADWATATELPGWDVKDCYSHVVGTERMLQGVALPPIDLSGLTHMTAPSAPITEPPVAFRRDRSGPEVLAELAEAAAERIAELRALPAERWDLVGPTPVGEAPYREFMNIRVFDCWMHEQDVRRALQRAGHQDGPVVEHALGRCTKALGFVVGKKAGAPDGAVVVFALHGSMARDLAVTVAGGRASVGPTDATPTVTLSMDQETFWCLGGGRWSPDAVLDADRVTFDGDADLGRAVVNAMNFMI
jgi:uncharacterized protein (TIGR03083 family)